MERRKILIYLAVFTIAMASLFAGGKAFAASGEEIFKAKKCGECHSVTKSIPKSFQDKLKKKGPDLWYAGSKYQKEWLEKFLSKPTLVRQLKYNSIEEKNNLKHVALSPADAKAVTDYLSTLKSKDVAQGVITKASKGIKGKLLFTGKSKSKAVCFGCHQIKTRAGKETGGFSGPSLINVGERLQGDWVYAYLKDRAVFDPFVRMPNFGKTFNDKELKMLSEYIMSFK
jgi:mono/diheme cytochrome c family protein